MTHFKYIISTHHFPSGGQIQVGEPQVGTKETGWLVGWQKGKGKIWEDKRVV